MSRARPVTIRELVGILMAEGWTELRQRGSHVLYGKNGQTISVVTHRSMRGEVSGPIAKKIIAQAKGQHVNKT